MPLHNSPKLHLPVGDCQLDLGTGEAAEWEDLVTALQFSTVQVAHGSIVPGELLESQ